MNLKPKGKVCSIKISMKKYNRIHWTKFEHEFDFGGDSGDTFYYYFYNGFVA
jgi:hypothetical protein